MQRRQGLLIAICLLVLAGSAWLRAVSQEQPTWREVAAGVWRSPGLPFSYALVDGEYAMLIDFSASTDGLPFRVEGGLLTHYHRDVCREIEQHLSKGVPIRASRESKDWLSREGVKAYWETSLPLRNSRTAYQVVPVGFDGIRFDLDDGHELNWRGWKVRAVATPGHARSHLTFTARKEEGPVIAFCGGAIAVPGKLWAPYTTDWDHWTDAGLTPTASSLRKLAALKPATLFPTHGDMIRNVAPALEKTAAAVAEIAFLKSFERFTKERLGNPPAYAFLAKEQAMSNGSKPWSRVSEHLFVTGNTFVLTSKDNACLMFDPWEKRSVEQFAKLQKDENLGRLEVAMFSHAHFDHYDGIYHFPEGSKIEVWALDEVAMPLAEPFRLRAPFLDARPVKFDRRPKDGDTLTWREYRFRFHHFPGQSLYTMGVESEIDGKRCFFTADNFFHQDMFSGSGGWMGLNRSFPLPYAASAQKVLDARPDWVLAEHGGPFEFNAEDFRRRVDWGKVSARAADAMCVSGNHEHDWNPHRVRVEPVVFQTSGNAIEGKLFVHNVLEREQKLTLVVEGRGWFADQTVTITASPRSTVERPLGVRFERELPTGRHVFALRGAAGADAFFAVDVRR